jgi:hypothetical protein
VAVLNGGVSERRKQLMAYLFNGALFNNDWLAVAKAGFFYNEKHPSVAKEENWQYPAIIQ